MRVLYVNHTARVSGGERSLLDLLRGLPDTVEPIVACPEGQLSAAVDDLGLRRYRIVGTDGSLKLDVRHTPRALAELATAAAQVRRLASRTRADIIHANSIRSGIVATSMRRSAPPVLVHVRDRLPPGPASDAALELIARRADLLASNSAYTAERLPSIGRERTRVVANPVDLERFDRSVISREQARAQLGVDRDRPLLALVAQVTPWKGQEEAIRAVDLLAQHGREAHLLLVGTTKFTSAATRYDNEAYLANLERLVAETGLTERVSFTGERDDVPVVLRASDVVLVPSWEEPFGRTVVEGMALGVPVVATAVGGPAEIIEHGRTGLLVEPHDPQALADAIRQLLDDGALAQRIAAAGRERAAEFSLPRHVAAVTALYAELTGRPGRP